MTRGGFARALGWCAALLLVSGGAAAEDKDSDAERLFREGQKLLEERRFGEACPKFEAAYGKDRQLGTLLNLAFCHKEQGAIWYAWLEFREAEVKATELNRPDRRDFARQRLAELDKLLPKVVVDNGRKLPVTDVLVEDRKVWEAERGTVFAAEAGQRKLTFRAKGKKPATLLVNVTATKGGLAQRVSVPEMEDLPPEEPPHVATAPMPAVRDVPAQAAAAEPDRSSTQRTIGWVALGVGGVAGVIGGVTGAITLFGNACAVDGECTQSEKDSGKSTGMISTVSFIVAGLGIGTGAILVLTAPSGSSSASSTKATQVTVAPQLGMGWAGVTGKF